ncbi:MULTISPECIES: MMPL family transporter [Parafrankia]|uniref:MMPL family transporter n=1 Tax=Parafrankia TaxID=2994362 RepID=UPI001F61B864|nr:MULTISPECIES: MMPL family transporter [Parafrankia]
MRASAVAPADEQASRVPGHPGNTGNTGNTGGAGSAGGMGNPRNSGNRGNPGNTPSAGSAGNAGNYGSSGNSGRHGGTGGSPGPASIPAGGRGGLFALLARIAINRPGRVLTITGLVIACLLPWAGGVFDRLATGGFYAAGDSATRAEAMLDAEFPGAPPNVAIMVTAPGTIDGPTARRLGEHVTGELRREPGVSGIVSYWSQEPTAGLLRSEDGRSGLVLFRLTGTEDAIARHIEALHDRYAHDGPGVMVRFGGAPAVMRDVTEQSRSDLERAELVTAPLVFVVLLFAFGGVAAALLPIVVGGTAVIASLALLRLLSEITHISVFSLNLTTALGFALAVDYCLFLLRRFREERTGGAPAPVALRTSLRTAGRTVLFSGLTVALSLTGALLFPLPYLRSYAYAGIAVVITSELAALLVLPAAVILLGERVERGRRWSPRRGPARPRTSDRRTADRRTADQRTSDRQPAGRRPAWRREPGAAWMGLARRVMAHPVLFGGAAVALMVLLALPLGNLRVALADDTVLPTTADSHLVNDAMRDDFTVCLPCQIPVVVPGVDAREPAVVAELGGYAARLSRVPGMARVDTVAGSYTDGALVAAVSAEAGQQFVGTHGGAWLSLWPTEPDPISSATQRTVNLVRDIPAPYPVEIGGLAPHLVETRDTVLRGLPGAIAVVVTATFVLLFLFTGSILLPLKALVLNALNLAAVMGVMVFVFQNGHLQNLVGHFQVSGTVELTSPVLMFCIAFGLSMDYEIFLLARIREEHLRGSGNRRAVARGLAATGPLLTCAALALIVVMVGVATSGISLIKMIGVGLALAVLLDVTVVRAVLVPAFMALAGRYNWWAPGPLRVVHERLGLREAGGEAAGEPADALTVPRGVFPAVLPVTSGRLGVPVRPDAAPVRPDLGPPRTTPADPRTGAPKALFSASTYGRAEDGLFDPDGYGPPATTTPASPPPPASPGPHPDPDGAHDPADTVDGSAGHHLPTLGERQPDDGGWSPDAWFSPHGDTRRDDTHRDV